MITTAEEYQKYLWEIQNENTPTSVILLPSDENIYEINLNTREIQAPEYLSLQDDHAAETIYFLVDRYYGNMDLAKTACVIQYVNAEKEEHFFSVPFYDITTFGTTVSEQFTMVVIDEIDYRQNKFYIQDENYNYVLTSEEFDPTQDYYLKVIPNVNKVYVKVDLTEKEYTPNNFYYMDTQEGSATFGQYCQDRGNFDPLRNYFAQIDRRYVPIALNASTYKKNCYFVINSHGNPELSSAPYQEDKKYFTLINSPKILVPWIVSGDVTKKDGIVSFSVRFYAVERVQGEQTGVENNLPVYNYSYPFIYNLNTKVAKSKVLSGLGNINQRPPDWSASEFEALQATVNQLSAEYQLFWEEAI